MFLSQHSRISMSVQTPDAEGYLMPGQILILSDIFVLELPVLFAISLHILQDLLLFVKMDI